MTNIRLMPGTINGASVLSHNNSELGATISSPFYR